MSVETEKLCVVAGDVTLDWNIMHCETGKLEIADFGGIRACWQRGGAALLADVISNLARSLPDRSEERRVGKECKCRCAPEH